MKTKKEAEGLKTLLKAIQIEFTNLNKLEDEWLNREMKDSNKNGYLGVKEPKALLARRDYKL